jgi:adenylate kinase
MVNTIVLLGRSGCGKNTQADLIGHNYGHIIISSGDLLRELATKPLIAGKKIAALLDQGGLPPAWLVDFLLIRYFLEQDPPAQMVLNGYPRRIGEAETFDEVMQWFGREKEILAILVDISREEAKRRLLSRARPDDSDARIEERLNWYESEVMPVVEYYESSQRLIRVNGEQSVEDVQKEIVDKLEGRM